MAARLTLGLLLLSQYIPMAPIVVFPFLYGTISGISSFLGWNTHNLSRKPGIFALPPTTTMLANIAGQRPGGSPDILCSTVSGRPGSFIPTSPGLKSSSGTVNLSFPSVMQSSTAPPVPVKDPILFIFALKEGS